MFLCVQTLQDKVCEFQARLRSEEVARHLLVQQLQQQSVQEKTCVGGGVQTSTSPNGESRSSCAVSLNPSTCSVAVLRTDTDRRSSAFVGELVCPSGASSCRSCVRKNTGYVVKFILC